MGLLFIQDRIGKDGVKFQCLKIETMSPHPVNTERILAMGMTSDSDPHLLPGRIWLRKSKLDELPQLVNILIGDMSFFGVRPILQEEFDLLSVNDQKRYIKYKPGLLGQYLFKDRFQKVNRGQHIKMAKAYLRLRARKETEGFTSNLSMNLEITRKTILFIIESLTKRSGV